MCLRTYHDGRVEFESPVAAAADAAGSMAGSDPKPDQKSYVFDAVFDEDAGQESVYDVVGRTMLSKVLGGSNGTIFAHGMSGTGKTHTMIGTSEEPGILQRIGMDLFQMLAEAEAAEDGASGVSRAHHPSLCHFLRSRCQLSQC